MLLRYMAISDIPQVMGIDQLSFDIPWSENSYRYEIEESDHSFMVVLETKVERPATRWQRWLGISQPPAVYIAGYGGMWKVVGEAHISTIAIHPRARGRGWGEILLAGMIQRAIMLEAEEVALEVRVSNTRAQKLYNKYGFETVSTKSHYYRNNNEDAYDMRLKISDEEIQAHFIQSYDSLAVKRPFTDCFSGQLPARNISRAF